MKIEYGFPDFNVLFFDKQTADMFSLIVGNIKIDSFEAMAF